MWNLLIWWWTKVWKTTSADIINNTTDAVVFHWDELRQELYDGLSLEDKKKYFPKMHRIFSWEIKWIDLIQEIWINEYMRLEWLESEYIFNEKIKPIIESMSESTKIVIEWVQLLPILVNKLTKWKQYIDSRYLIRDNVEEILVADSEHIKESEQQWNYRKSFSANKIVDWEAENQYLLHTKVKAEFSKKIEEELEELWLEHLIVDTAVNFKTKINDVIKLIKK